ncbi:hypothetical protein NMG60_11020659 [Bertholletia excelsa]
MECNKDEAIRAKEIAESKMQNDDFEGARKFAQKAQQLFPELENILQLLMVCDVHCSARNKICGFEMDWYGILQIEKFADEVAIKKQYRKLALVLHPDKNKFPGAEAAFKLIGEANRVLSDKVKRAAYDNKCRISMKQSTTKPPAQQLNRNPPAKQHPPTQSTPANGVRQTFWTSCPFCAMRYQYYREFVNKALHCQHCAKLFIAYDSGAQRPNNVQPEYPRKNHVESQGSFKVGSQSTSGFPPSHLRYQSRFNCKTGSMPEGGNANKESTKAGAGSAKFGAENLEGKRKEEKRNTETERERKLVQESSESSETATSGDADDNKIIQEKNVGGSAGQNCGVSGVRHTQRSLRKRQHVSYNENLSDDDGFMSPPKKSRENESSLDSKDDQKEGTFNSEATKSDNLTGFAPAEERDKKDSKPKENGHPVGSGGVRARKVKGEEAEAADRDPKKSEVIDNSESDSDCAPEPEYFECPDPEFNDFDKDKEDGCFAIDQVWACYDPVDSMPRYYARIRRVYASEFRLRITWLEPSPESQDEINWFNKDLPIACGKFVQGKSEETADRLTFSHRVHYEKGSSRYSYKIYPRKGETWALFKDWDISWSSQGENFRKYNYEIVEVISDFIVGVGIRVTYLEKVEGFVSLFQQTTGEGIVTFLIPPTELLRFSHRIPSFKLTGTEREGVPKGSFELDPASVPLQFYKSDSVNSETEKSGAVNHSDSESPDRGVKPMSAEKFSTPKKGFGFEGKNDIKETFELRRSPRGLSNGAMKYVQTNGSRKPTVNVVEDQKDSNLIPSKRVTPSQGGGNRNSCIQHAGRQLSTSPSISLSFSPAGKITIQLHNFNEHKSEGNIQPGQVWAFYSNEDKLPKNYALVKKIESCPFRMYISVLEACTVSKDAAQAICCGTFRIKGGRPFLFSPTFFSHLVEAKTLNKSSFEIYPRAGQVWALYKDWNAEMSSSDMKHCRYEIVEVIEGNQSCVRVSPLLCLKGCDSVFMAPRRQRSSSCVIEIPLDECTRFSHQIPAIKLAEEKSGSLRGCWELDPASIPGNLS